MKSRELEFNSEPAKPEIRLEGNDWVLPTRLEVLEQVRDELERRLIQLGWREENIKKIVTATDEAVTNAIIHGNLEVSEQSEYGREREREQQIALALKTELAERSVYIAVSIDQYNAIISVRDEGKRIPVGKFLDPTKTDNLLKKGGRGVFLMQRLCDKVEFDGSQVILYKVNSKEN